MKKLLTVFLLFCHFAFCGYGGYILFQTVPANAGSSPLAPYSLLISGTFPEFATTANGGKVVNTVPCGVDSIVCPADLVFTRDSGCTAPYSGWDIFVYSQSTGQLSASVQIPTLSNTTPAKVYGCVGNTLVTTFQGGSRGAGYDDDYMLALHMEETSGTVLHDSTANARDAVKKAVASPSPMSSGEVGAAQTFLGTVNSSSNDFALFNSLTPPASTYTIEYWTKANSFNNLDSVFLQNSSGSPTAFTGFYWYPAGTIYFWNSYNSTKPTGPATAGPGVWHYIVFVRNSDTINQYLDGVAGTPATGLGTGTEQWKGLGWDRGATPGYGSFNGAVDEVFYSNTARSADYVTARFHNLSSPATFYTVGAYTAVLVTPASVAGVNTQINIF